MARLYANENFPQPVVSELRLLGHDVITVLETGNAGLSWPDVDVLTFATKENRAVITLNRRHFVRLAAERSDHAGVIVCSFDSNFSAHALRIDTAIRERPSLVGCLIRVNRLPQ